MFMGRRIPPGMSYGAPMIRIPRRRELRIPCPEFQANEFNAFRSDLDTSETHLPSAGRELRLHRVHRQEVVNRVLDVDMIMPGGPVETGSFQLGANQFRARIDHAGNGNAGFSLGVFGVVAAEWSEAVAAQVFRQVEYGFGLTIRRGNQGSVTPSIPYAVSSRRANIEVRLQETC